MNLSGAVAVNNRISEMDLFCWETVLARENLTVI